MKKIIALLTIAGGLVTMGCTNNNKPAEVKKETIIVPSTKIVVEPPKKSTAVTLDKNGVKVEVRKNN